MPPELNFIIGLPGLRLTKMESEHWLVDLDESLKRCAACHSKRVWVREKIPRRIRHESLGSRPVWLVVQWPKFECRACGAFRRASIPGILRYQRASEPFKKEVIQKHHHGISQTRLASLLGIGSATIERYYQKSLAVKIRELSSRICPRVLGIDEHFFTRKKGFATTLVDLSKHYVFDVTLGRSEKSLQAYLHSLQGKDRVQVIVMDLSETYRSLARRHFPNALIVADRFHVVRLINHSFLKVWSLLDPTGRKNRGLLSLLHRHPHHLKAHQVDKLNLYLEKNPALHALYDFRCELNALMITKGTSKKQARAHACALIQKITALKESAFESMQTLGVTLDSWLEPIARMWRFTKTNSITEGFHNRMEEISRRAYGFKSFQRYRIRVLASCGYPS